MRKALVVLTLIVAIAPELMGQRQRAVRVPVNYQPEMRQITLAVTNRVLATYANADFSPIWKRMDEHPQATENALYMVIPPVRAFALVVKYENETPDPALIKEALGLLEFSTDRYNQWGRGWISPSVVNFHALCAYRIRQHSELPMEVKNEAEIVWTKIMAMTQSESDFMLALGLPTPWDSSTTGDTKAEEFAWGATPLAAAAVWMPEHGNATSWERRMKQYGYDAITRPSDPVDIDGMKIVTVTEDFRLNNHNIDGNPYYTIATPQLLQQAALPYRMMGKLAPEELYHNVKPLYDVYKTYCAKGENGQFYWNRPSDPGDPTLFPLGMANDPEHDLMLGRARVASGRLWAEVNASGPIPDADFFATIQNHKVGWYYIVGMYLWYYPTPN